MFFITHSVRCVTHTPYSHIRNINKFDVASTAQTLSPVSMSEPQLDATQSDAPLETHLE